MSQRPDAREPAPPPSGGGGPPRPRLPRGVWVLGFVSLLMDVSSEMIHSLLPLFMVGTLGASLLAVGVIEGIAEATALIVKVFSGVWSDRLGRRKGLAALGYAMGAFSKPLFALSGGLALVVTARFVDRVGKGIRGAPRDALLADLSPPERRGEAFGLRQSLDTVGAFAGPLLASGLMVAWAGDFRAVFWVAVVPGLLSVLLLIVGVREEPRAPRADIAASGARAAPVRFDAWRRFGPAYWRVVAIGAVFTLARFSEAFLALRAQHLGVPTAAVPLVMVAMSAVYALSAWPFGRLADRMSPVPLLAGGLGVLVLADLVLASATNWTALAAGVLLWGLHMGMTQGLLPALVAAEAPADLRGTAFGLFNLASGVAMLLASVVAGALWQALGAEATFYAGAVFSAAALAALVRTGRIRAQRGRS